MTRSNALTETASSRLSAAERLRPSAACSATSALDAMSVGLTADPVSAGSDEEVEVGAGVGLHDVVDVELRPAAYRRRVRSLSDGVLAAELELFVGHVEAQDAVVDV